MWSADKIYQGVAAIIPRAGGTFGHGFTASGHPVAAAVALETLKIYEERDIVGPCAARRAEHSSDGAAHAAPTIRWSA